MGNEQDITVKIPSELMGKFVAWCEQNNLSLRVLSKKGDTNVLQNRKVYRRQAV